MLNNQNYLDYGLQKKKSSSWTQIKSRLSNQSWRYSSLTALTMRCLYDGPHPCGKCPACLANRQRAFCFRLDQEKDKALFYYWLTLQYSDEYVPHTERGEMCFSKEHCRRLFETLRKRYKKQDLTFKHFLVSEYGPNATHRPHYHCLLLVYSDRKRKIKELVDIRSEMRDFIRETWYYGHVEEKSFHGRVISYLTKYCCKPELVGEYHEMKPFTLISPGIGKCYVDSLSDDRIQYMIEHNDFTVHYGSGKMQLPRYIVDKIFPHSKQDLLDSVPSDFDSAVDLQQKMTEYQKLYLLRLQMQRDQNALQLQKANANLQKYGDDSAALARDKESHRRQRFAEFKANLKNRKNL